MNGRLFKNFSKWNFIKNINNKTFLQVSLFAMNAKKLTNNEKNIIIERLISFNDAALIVSCIGRINWLTKENIDLLTEAIVKLAVSGEIISFVRAIKNLSDENINLLTNAIAETNDYASIIKYVQIIKKLNQENISKLTKIIVRSENPDYIFKFACHVKGLSEEDKMVLVKGINRTNNFDGILYFIEFIDWINENHRDLLIEECFKHTKSAYNIITFASEFDLSEKNIDILTKYIIDIGNTGGMCTFAQTVTLTKKNKDDLTKALAATSDAKNISEFAINVPDLTEDNIADLTVAMVKTNDSKSLYEFLINVPNLKKENCKVIVDRIFELNDFNVIKLMIDAYVAGHCINRIGVDLKYRVMRTKDSLLIAYYLFIKKSEDLIERLFGSNKKFLLFIYMNKDKLGIHDNQLEEFTEKTSFKYVDDNIKYYLENSSEMKVYKTF